MPKHLIKLHFQNGLTFQSFKKEVFDIEGLTDLYDFEESANQEFIIFGPYGNDIPPKGNYTRIGYFCENIKPDLSICEWAFGIPFEEEVNNPRYKRIQWHGLNPTDLIKPDDYNAENTFEQKKHFCNFLYSHQVPYREEFFKQLSKYKKIDAPGRSMNNMQSIDQKYMGNIWQRKQQFLGGYKFTIAFENYVYPGYQTEKLYDAMLANSIPIYCGDPYINKIFNTESFINAVDYTGSNNSTTVNLLEKYAQQNFRDIRPSYYQNPLDRVKRKLKATGRLTKMNLQFKKLDFSRVIEKIIELDQDKSKYIQTLKQPWFNGNTPPLNASLKNRWVEIFDTKKS